MIKLNIYAAGIGSTVFTRRLGEYLSKHYPIKLVKEGEDIYLSCVWAGKKTNKKAVHIHRVDGVYFDLQMSGKTGMNNKVKVAMKRAHGVVYQSEYSKKICKGILGVSKRESVIIPNGVDPDSYKDVEIDKMGYSKMLVACAKWRPLKRPKSIAKGFVKAGLDDTVLVMIGDVPAQYRVKHPNIKYVGSVRTRDIYKYYASCDGLIHISRLDACPNVVVEALVAGKPILGNNVGGTPELIKKDGVIVKIDPPYNYKMFNMGNPDRVQSDIIASGINKLVSKEWNVHRPDLHISHTAKKYYRYFEHMLSRYK